MVRFKVEKMGCGSCAKFDTRAVQGVEPTTGVEVDPGAKLVSVSGVTGPADRIARAIAEAGYSAEPA
ncbi:heavy-metal-associated domain-containing protein [Methylobacterium sp. E-065]|uniref:heavy-metal-associated domain-containing protein n=1 Tax=Methylobacterium sp. E-065 TaxID=2836583 RepID=UPI001FBBCCD5|nr:heavy-metal-associated domain-containing protein [Methylobacterium sp. E-065]MCJ2020048.1 heavy-metal-associated domain-containing protein [Methylobacterium sp. E-065]